MRNFFKFFGVITLAVVIGFSMIACDDDSGSTDSALNGTWVGENGKIELELKNGSFTMSESGTGIYRGSYTTAGNTATMTLTGFYGAVLAKEIDGIDATKWYSKNDLKALGFDDEDLDEIFGSATYTYSVEGDTLTLTDEDGDEEVYTRKK